MDQIRLRRLRRLQYFTEISRLLLIIPLVCLLAVFEAPFYLAVLVAACISCLLFIIHQFSTAQDPRYLLARHLFPRLKELLVYERHKLGGEWENFYRTSPCFCGSCCHLCAHVKLGHFFRHFDQVMGMHPLFKFIVAENT